MGGGKRGEVWVVKKNGKTGDAGINEQKSFPGEEKGTKAQAGVAGVGSTKGSAVERRESAPAGEKGRVVKQSAGRHVEEVARSEGCTGRL